MCSMEIIMGRAYSSVGEADGARRRLWRAWLGEAEQTRRSAGPAVTRLRPTVFHLKWAADWISSHPDTLKSVCSMPTTTGLPLGLTFIRTITGCLPGLC